MQLLRKVSSALSPCKWEWPPAARSLQPGELVPGAPTTSLGLLLGTRLAPPCPMPPPTPSLSETDVKGGPHELGTTLPQDMGIKVGAHAP